MGAALTTLLAHPLVAVLTFQRASRLLDTVPPADGGRCTGAMLLMLATAHLLLEPRPLLVVLVPPLVCFGLPLPSREPTVTELRTRFVPSRTAGQG